MSNTRHGVILFIIIACVITGYFLLSPRETSHHQTIISEQSSPPLTEKSSSPKLSESEPLTRHPLPASVGKDNNSAEPLPPLADSDIAIQQALEKFGDAKQLDQLFIFKNFIDHMVVTTDNLPRTKLPVQRLPTKSPSGKFMVRKSADGSLEIDPENYQRYTPYVRFIEGLDSQAVAKFYFRFYPLFQEAYTNLGYKSAYFNDRVIAVIDDLLATPDVSDPVKLIQPSVFYKYKDPRLESLSAGQRLLIRIGSDNSAKIKAKLRELRAAFTKPAPN